MPRDPGGLPCLCAACSGALSCPLCQLPWAGRKAEGQKRGSCPLCHPSPCRERVPPIRNGTSTGKEGRIRAGRDSHWSGWPAQVSCQVGKTWPFSQGQAALVAVGCVHLAKVAMAVWCRTLLYKMRALLVCLLHSLQNLATNISAEMPLGVIFLFLFCLGLFVASFPVVLK